MERPFEKYSLLLLVTIFVHSAITITNKRNKRERNSYKWSLHQSAVATPRSSSVLKTYMIVSVKTTMIHPITTLICMTFLRAAFSDFSLNKISYQKEYFIIIIIQTIKKSILSSSSFLGLFYKDIL